MNSNQTQIIHAITTEILSTINSLESERHFSGHDPDKMDDRIKALQERLNQLRTVRADLELNFANPRI